MAINFAREKEASVKIMEAMKTKDEAQIKAAWQNFHKSVAEQISADFAEVQQSNDAAILAQRGYRQLTSQEVKWYQKLSAALKSSNPKEAFTALIGTDIEEDMMPTTIFEDVYKDLEDEHPLLKKVSFQYVGYITKWIMNDHTAQRAIWGAVNEEITKEITSSFKIMDVTQAKLSAYAFIQKDMLDLGPTFLDAYIRRVLKEAMACGLEYGIINGTGVNEPIGLIRDIHKGVSFNSETGYPAKEKIAVTSFAPAEYGPLVARMAQKENGKKRKIGTVTLICNQTDYLTKVMPATTVMNADGKYVNDLFPIPTEVIISNELNDGDAILAILPEYHLFAGGKRGETLEYSDDFKFLDDLRYFKTKQFATGRAWDNTSALYLNISDLDPAYITVKNLETVTA
jgi:HK97 family phage major capsid protein